MILFNSISVSSFWGYIHINYIIKDTAIVHKKEAVRKYCSPIDCTKHDILLVWENGNHAKDAFNNYYTLIQ